MIRRVGIVCCVILFLGMTVEAADLTGVDPYCSHPGKIPSVPAQGRGDIATALEILGEAVGCALRYIMDRKDTSAFGRLEGQIDLVIDGARLEANIGARNKARMSLQNLVSMFEKDVPRSIKVANAQLDTGFREDAYKTLRGLEAPALARFRRFRVAPNSNEERRALENIAEALSRAGHEQEAVDLLKRTIRIAKSIQGEWDRVEALKSIAMVQARIGDIGGALASADPVPGALRPIVLKAIALAQLGAGDAKGAEETASRITGISYRIAKTEYDTVKKDSLKMMARGGAAPGLLFKAKVAKIAREFAVDAPQQEMGILAEIAEFYRSVGNATEVRRIVGKGLSLAELYPNESASSLEELVPHAACCEEMERALLIVERVGNAGVREGLLHVIIQTAARDGDAKAAWNFFSKLGGTDRYLRIERSKSFSLSKIALAEARGGNNSAARNTFGKALDLARGDAESLYQIGVDLVRAVFKREAKKAFQLALEAAPNQDHVFGRNVALRMIDMGDRRAAEELSKKFNHYWIWEDVMAQVALSYAREGNVASALERLASIKDEWSISRVLPLVEVGTSQVRRGDVKGALNTLGMLCLIAGVGTDNELETMGKEGRNRRTARQGIQHIVAGLAERGEVEAVSAWVRAPRKGIGESYALLGLAEGIWRGTIASSK